MEFSYTMQPGLDRLEHLRHEAEHERRVRQLTRQPNGVLMRLRSLLQRQALPRDFEPTNAEWAAAICYFQVYDAP